MGKPQVNGLKYIGVEDKKIFMANEYSGINYSQIYAEKIEKISSTVIPFKCPLQGCLTGIVFD